MTTETPQTTGPHDAGLRRALTALRSSADDQTRCTLLRLMVLDDVFAFYVHQDPGVGELLRAWIGKKEALRTPEECPRPKASTVSQEVFLEVLSAVHWCLPDWFPDAKADVLAPALASWVRPEGGRLTAEEWNERLIESAEDDCAHLLELALRPENLDLTKAVRILAHNVLIMDGFCQEHRRLMRGFEGALEQGLSGTEDTDRYLSWCWRWHGAFLPAFREQFPAFLEQWRRQKDEH